MTLIQTASPDENSRQQLERLIAAWMEELDAAQRAGETKRKYADAVRRFYRWCHAQEPPRLLGDVTRGDVCLWRDNQLSHYGPSTVAIKLAALRSFYDFAVERDLVSRNPADRVKCASDTPRAMHRRDELTDDEASALLASCNKRLSWQDDRVQLRDRAILNLMLYCALRTIEVSRASREDLEKRRGRLILWVQGKGHRSPDRYVIIPAPAERALREWLAVHPQGATGPLFVSLSKRGQGRLTTNFIRRMVKTRLRSCGIDSPTKTTHSLRHSAISRAHRGGAGLLSLMDFAGHAKPETTRRYLHESKRLRKATEDGIRYGSETD